MSRTQVGINSCPGNGLFATFAGNVGSKISTPRRGRLKCGSGKNGGGNIGTKERENADDENAGVETSARLCRGRKWGS